MGVPDFMHSVIRNTARQVAVSLISAVSLIVVGLSEEASARTFKNCAQLRSMHPQGVAINFGAAGGSGAYISREIYLRNQRMDRDRDGIICEVEA